VLSFLPRASSGPIARLLAGVTGVVLLIAALMFSAVILAIVAVAGSVAWGYFWWKTRKLRQAMQDNPPGGVVIDGEASVVDDVEPQGRVISVEVQDKR